MVPVNGSSFSDAGKFLTGCGWVGGRKDILITLYFIMSYQENLDPKLMRTLQI